MRDLTEDLAALRRRLDEAEKYLALDAKRTRLAELEQAVARPDLWDDVDAAKAITSEYSRVNEDVTMLDDLARQVNETADLYVMAAEEDDDSVEAELVTAV